MERVGRLLCCRFLLLLGHLKGVPLSWNGPTWRRMNWWFLLVFRWWFMLGESKHLMGFFFFPLG